MANPIQTGLSLTGSQPLQASTATGLRSVYFAYHQHTEANHDPSGKSSENEHACAPPGAHPGVLAGLLECKVLESPLGHLDLYEFAGGEVLGLFFVGAADAPSEADYLNATWLEIKVDDPVSWKARLQAFGVQEVEYPDPSRFFFAAPGGPVFRLAPIDGGL